MDTELQVQYTRGVYKLPTRCLLGTWEHQVSAGEGALLIVHIKILLFYYCCFPNQLCMPFHRYSFFFFSSFLVLHPHTFLVEVVKTDCWLPERGGFLGWEEIGKEEGKGTKRKTGHELVLFCLPKNRSPAYLGLFLIVVNSM